MKTTKRNDLRIKNIWINETVWQRFKAKCALENRTIGSMLGDLILGYLEKKEGDTNETNNRRT